jgi:anti-sigma regulatory factor (Ser/Thr protein kinase)
MWQPLECDAGVESLQIGGVSAAQAEVLRMAADRAGLSVAEYVLAAVGERAAADVGVVAAAGDERLDCGLGEGLGWGAWDAVVTVAAAFGDRDGDGVLAWAPVPAAAMFRDRFVRWRVPGDGVSELSAVRRRVAGVLSGWGLRPLADDVGLVAHELVVNAVLHGEAPVVVELRVEGAARVLRCEVGDASAVAPRPRSAGPWSESGRGWALTAAVAKACGWYRVPDGKVVWFTVGLPAAGDDGR